VWGNAVLGPIRKNADEPVLAEPAWLRLRPLARACRSNNYALDARYFERPDASWAHVLEHGRADRTFRALRVTVIPRYLSVKNTSPASTVFLENGLRHDFSPARLRTLVRQYVARFDAGRPHLDARLRWADASITAVGQFFRELADTAR
jgi:hypothetical protein